MCRDRAPVRRTRAVQRFGRLRADRRRHRALPVSHHARGVEKCLHSRRREARGCVDHQASAGLQDEFAGGILASADFVYTRATNLASLVNLNQPLPDGTCNNALPYPNFGFIECAQNGKSTHKGVDKRFDKGYAFGVAYTIGESKDNLGADRGLVTVR